MKDIIKILQDIEDSGETMKRYDLICSLGGVVSLLNLKIDNLQKKMTSQNSIHYLIFDNNGNNVGTHRQNMMCKRNNDGLEKYKPHEKYTIVECNEDYDFEEDKLPLNEWLLKNKAEFTFKHFEKGNKVKAWVLISGQKKLKIEACVLEKFKGKWHPYYTLRTEEGVIFEEVQQTDIIPL